MPQSRIGNQFMILRRVTSMSTAWLAHHRWLWLASWPAGWVYLAVASVVAASAVVAVSVTVLLWACPPSHGLKVAEVVAD